jgi:ketosteroid isomerase-like protein
MTALPRRFAFVALESCVLLWGFAMTGAAQTAAATSDSSAAVTIAAQFHQALARGDSGAAANLLAPDVFVLESGELERRADYLGHHLPADIAFAKAVPSTRVVRQVTIAGDAAWIVATSSTAGTFEGRAVRSEGAELMVLRRVGGSWRIAAVHWSSRRARTGS